MNVKDLFKYGVTPNAGPNKGKRFEVVSIHKDCISVVSWGGPKDEYLREFRDGEYDLWQPSKTILETHEAVTWGKLKEAMVQNNFDDDTKFFIKSDMFESPALIAHARLSKERGENVILIHSIYG